MGYFNILELKIKNLQDFIDLKKVVENNPWHNNQSVYDHTLLFIENLKKIIKRLNKNLKKILDYKIIKLKRKEILILAGYFHDIAKKETILINKNGFTSCPNHERIGADKTKKIILKNFKEYFSDKDLKNIIRLIRYHGEIHHFLFNKKSLLNFKRKCKDIYLELILLAYSDTKNSYLKITNPKEYKERINFYINELNVNLL